MQKVKITWSHYKLPGFKKEVDSEGYVLCEECHKMEKLKELIEDCQHAEE